MSNTSNKSYLNDAMHLMEGVVLLDEELATVESTVDQSKRVVVSARMDLERHRQWLEHHRELYAKDLALAQRHIRRNGLIRASRQAVLLPARLLTYAGMAFFGKTRTEPSSRARHEQLQRRISSA